MFTNISRSYGISITNRCTFRMPTTVRNAVSFWISFNKANFGSRQLICTNRTVNHDTTAPTRFYLVKDTDNIIKAYLRCNSTTSTPAGEDTYSEIFATYSTVQPDTLYHIVTAVSPDNKTGLTGSVISQGNGVWIDGVPYFNTSIFGAGTSNYYIGLSTNQSAGLNFGNYLTNFNIFDLVIKGTDDSFTIAECQNLYNGGQGINLEGNDAILQLNQIGKSGGLGFITKIGNFLLKEKFKTEFISSPQNTDSTTLGIVNNFYGVAGTPYTQRLISSTSSKNGFLSILTNTGCSIPVTYYDDSANRQPYRNGSIVKHQASYYELPQVPVTVNGKTYNDPITPYFYDGVSHIYVYNINHSKNNYYFFLTSPTAKEVALDRVSITGDLNEIYLVTATGSSIEGGISSQNLFAYTITNCNFSYVAPGQGSTLELTSGKIETDVVISSTIFGRSIGFTRLPDSSGFKNLTITSCTFATTSTTDMAIIDRSGYFGEFVSGGDVIGSISITSFVGYMNINLNLESIPLLSQKSITSFICTPTSVTTGGLTNPILSFYNCSNLSNITITSNYLYEVGLPNNSVLTTLSLSGTGLSGIGLISTKPSGLTAGQIVLPSNNTITNLSISNSTNLTSINRIPTSLTALTLSGLGITGSIDLSGLTTNSTSITGINLSGSFSSITMNTSRTYLAFSYNGSFISPNTFTASGINTPGMFTSASNSKFSISNAICNDAGNSGGVALGVSVTSRDINIGNSSSTNSMGLTALALSIQSLYNNWATFSTVPKTLNMSDPLITPKGLTAPFGYIQATAGTPGNDGTFTTSNIGKIREIAYVLVNQNISNGTQSKYNWSVTL